MGLGIRTRKGIKSFYSPVSLGAKAFIFGKDSRSCDRCRYDGEEQSLKIKIPSARIAWDYILMQLTPTIAIHLAFASSAVLLGPLALWTRLGSTTRPRWHRALGYAWVTCMVGTATSGIFIRDYQLPNFAGYTPIHILIPVTFLSLWRAFRYLAQGNHRGHQLTMQWTYGMACVVTGLFTLLPQRYLGQIVWGG